MEAGSIKQDSSDKRLRGFDKFYKYIQVHFLEVPKQDTLRKTIKKARPDAWNSTEAMEVDGDGDGDGDGDDDDDTILKRARDDVGEPVVSEDAKRQKVEEDRKNAVNVADAIKDVECGVGAWNVSEKFIFFASCMHVRPTTLAICKYPVESLGSCDAENGCIFLAYLQGSV